MANRGWDSTLTGPGWSSTARTTGRETGTGEAESFIRPNPAADSGIDNSPMDSRSDVFMVPGRVPTVDKP